MREDQLSTTQRKPGRRQPTKAKKLPQLRNSERGTFKACEFKWSLGYGRQLQPITAAPALRFGTLVHGALARYYKPGIKRGPKPATTFLKLYEEELKSQTKMGFRDEDDKWQDAGELGVAMLENYVDHYGADDEWEVIVTEYPFEVTVCVPATNQPWFEIVGVLDGLWLWRPKKTLWIPDHKTTSGIGGTTQHPNIPVWLQLDDQAGTYWSYGVEALLAKGLIPKGKPLSGMLFNFLSKKMPDERPYKIINHQKIHLNKDGTVSKKQPSPYFVRQPIYRDEHDREVSKQRTMDDYRRIELVRHSSLRPLKTPGMFTCTMCPFRDPCELHETGNDWESMLDQTTQTWDPYAEHEIKEGR